MQTFTTEEAFSARKSQTTTSSFSALIIAGVLHALVIGGLAIWYLAGPEPKEPELIVSSPVGDLMQQVKPKKELSNVVKQAPAAPSSQMTKVITSRAAVSAIAVPDAPDMTLDTVDLGVGFGDGFGAGMGLGGDGFGSGGGPPKGSPLADRCSPKDRARRLAEGGGSPETEAAVVKGLEWLKTQQASDGSWGGSSKSAMTGLALLAYLGHCETYDSPQYAETVRKAIFFLAELALNNDGKITTREGHAWVYEHGIGTYAICEAYSLLRYGKRRFPHIEQLKEAINMAVPIIIKGQNHDGGWVYEYEGSEWYKETTGKQGATGNGDTSVAGWHMQALKAATLTGLEFKDLKRTIRSGIKFLQGVQGPQGGFGYRNRGDRYSLAGIGALAQQMLSGSSSSIRRAVKFILDHEVQIGAPDACIYGWYYGAQACFQRGGRDWEKWNTMFRDQAVAHQSPDGSWPFEGGEGAASSMAAGAGDAPVYRTSLFILMLEVYYRYLPATE
ncbi:MAG: hypothetical protein ABF370_04455 [Verrucomicrobiales bacterium]